MSRMLRFAAPGTAVAVLVATGALSAGGASASPIPSSTSPTPTSAASTSAASTSAGSSAAPAGFKAQSTHWLDKRHGFLLGSAPCGQKTCSDVLGTSDAGTTWSLLGHPHARIAQQGKRHPGVTEVRMGTAKAGWAFAPLLRHTNDGGKTWTTEPIPGGSGQVLSLATDAVGSWAVVSPCAWAQASQSCRKSPLTVWRTTTATGSTWTQVDAKTPYGFSASVSAFGSTVYVVDPQLEVGGSDVVLASTNGKTFSSRPSPCDPTLDLGLVSIVATSATNVAELCDGNPGFSKAVKTVYTSTDTGQTLENRGTMGPYGIRAQLAASPSGNLAVASWSSGSFIYINDSHTKTWQMPIGLGDGGLGWNDILYVTATEAYVVYSPAGSFEGKGQLWVTHDGGRDWHMTSI